MPPQVSRRLGNLRSEPMIHHESIVDIARVDSFARSVYPKKASPGGTVRSGVDDELAVGESEETGHVNINMPFVNLNATRPQATKRTGKALVVKPDLPWDVAFREMIRELKNRR